MIIDGWFQERAEIQPRPAPLALSPSLRPVPHSLRPDDRSVLLRTNIRRRMSATLPESSTSNLSVTRRTARGSRKEGPLEDAQANEVQQEATKIRRLQIMVSMVMSVISQDPNLTVEEASELVAGTKRAALAMFPDKELAYDILYKPRLQRLMKERFRLQ